MIYDLEDLLADLKQFIHGELVGVRGEIADLRGEITDVKGEVASLAANMDSRFHDQDEKFDTILEALGDKMTDYDKQFNQHATAPSMTKAPTSASLSTNWRNLNAASSNARIKTAGTVMLY